MILIENYVFRFLYEYLMLRRTLWHYLYYILQVSFHKRCCDVSDAHVKAAASGCSHCNVKLPPRASHCNVCCQCYAVRDHHCIW